MPDDKDLLQELLDRIKDLQAKQETYQEELRKLQSEVSSLKAEAGVKIKSSTADHQPGAVTLPPLPKPKYGSVEDAWEKKYKAAMAPPPLPGVQNGRPLVRENNLEKFIGENLIAKIGIGITIIGAGIGVKYSIEHDIIGPGMRIILGYVLGLLLIATAFRLQKNYANFSAVLMSGGLAIMYFITYAANAFYGFIPQIPAYALMVLFTAATVFIAIRLDKQVIAHLGLVGAYGVPFLLGDWSDGGTTILTYMAIINGGVLIISLIRYWKSLYYSSFFLTWLIFTSWCLIEYDKSGQFGLAMTFLAVFFLLFYGTFMAYKILHKSAFKIDDTFFLLLNSFIAYGLGYGLLNGQPAGENYLGAFTIAHAIVHSLVAVIIYQNKLADRNMRYLVTGLVIVFLTMAIPVQFDGNWVTFLWAGEAAVLFWVGRKSAIAFYEKFAYAAMALAFFSLMHDWASLFDNYYPQAAESFVRPFFHLGTLTSLFCLISFGIIYYVNRMVAPAEGSPMAGSFWQLLAGAIPFLFVATLFIAIEVEIALHFHQLYLSSEVSYLPKDQEYPDYVKNWDIMRMRGIWMINFGIAFFASLLLLLKKWGKRNFGAYTSYGLMLMSMAAFFLFGFPAISEMSLNLSQDEQVQLFERQGSLNLLRYPGFALILFAVFSGYQFTRSLMRSSAMRVSFEIIAIITFLWLLSLELMHWVGAAGAVDSSKLALSILWGVYSLVLIGLGIYHRLKHLRIFAIILFAVTLVKLFIYDLNDMNTGAKTVVFLVLGILLLIISFLYNKYKGSIFEEPGD